MVISFSSHPIFYQAIATKFCTWHDSIAVVSCAKICCDLITMEWINAKWIWFRIWISVKDHLTMGDTYCLWHESGFDEIKFVIEGAGVNGLKGHDISQNVIHLSKNREKVSHVFEESGKVNHVCSIVLIHSYVMLNGGEEISIFTCILYHSSILKWHRLLKSFLMDDKRATYLTVNSKIADDLASHSTRPSAVYSKCQLIQSSCFFLS